MVYGVGRFKNISLHSKLVFETVKTMAIIFTDTNWVGDVSQFMLRNCFSYDLFAGMQVFYWFKYTLAWETETHKCSVHSVTHTLNCRHLANSYYKKPNKLLRLKMFLLLNISNFFWYIWLHVDSGLSHSQRILQQKR